MFLLLNISSCKKRDTSLSYNLVENRVYRLEMALEQEISSAVLNQPVLKQDIDVGLDFSIRDVSYRGYILEVSIPYLRYKRTGNLGEYSFDSKKDVVRKSGPSSLLGRVFTLEMSWLGEVFLVDGFGLLVEDVLEGSSKGFGDSFLKSFLPYLLPCYPKKRVGEGSSWDRDGEITGFFPSEYDFEYHFKKPDKIYSEREFSHHKSGIDFYNRSGNHRFSLSGKEKANYSIGSDGWPVSGKMEGVLELEMKREKRGSQIGFRHPYRIKQSLHLRGFSRNGN